MPARVNSGCPEFTLANRNLVLHSSNLINVLKERLTKAGITLNSCSIDELLLSQEEAENKTINSLADVISTVILLAKGKEFTPDELVSKTIMNKTNNKNLVIMTKFIFEDYQKYLHNINSIDFVDMLIKAKDLTESNNFINKFKYVIIDEYQDISSAQYNLLIAMRKQFDYELYCVGDDWQSIYRFAGSDINYILDFDKYWHNSSIKYIEKTYRFPSELVNITGHFIMSNPRQFIKYISSNKTSKIPVLGIIEGYNEDCAVNFLIEKLKDTPRNKSIFMIGRYTFDIELLEKSSLFDFSYNIEKKCTNIKLAGRPDLKIYFYTAHKSKGLQADYVYIISVC